MVEWGGHHGGWGGFGPPSYIVKKCPEDRVKVQSTLVAQLANSYVCLFVDFSSRQCLLENLEAES